VFRRLLLGLLAARLVRPPGETCRVDLECHPGLPYHRNMLWKVALYAGIRLRPYRGGEPADAARPTVRLFWPQVDPAAAPAREPPACWWRGALNGGSRDTSKRTVARVFGEVFGYPLALDPVVHVGPCLAKSNGGSRQDGRVLDCPVAEVDPALAYQVLVDNRAEDGALREFRVPVIGGEIPFVYVKRRSLGARFSNTNLAVSVVAPGEVFSEPERARLLAFCRAMRLDLVELDVLRDRGDGRVYVVDANRPAWGPPRPMRTADAVRAVRAYAAAFARLAGQAGRSP
jgi:hypothetical protein